MSVKKYVFKWGCRCVISLTMALLSYSLLPENTRNFAIVHATNDGKWIQANDGRWWYKHSDGGYMKSSWELINGKWYYFDESGWMKQYWIQVYGKYYWLGQDGSMKYGWQQVWGKWYYLGGSDDGSMKTGWQKIGGKWYYLGGSEDGVMKSGWQKIGDKWYYLGGSDDGSMKIGWQHIAFSGVYDGKPYWNYFNSSGEFETDSDVRGRDKGYNTFGYHKNNSGIKLDYTILSSVSSARKNTINQGAGLWNNAPGFKGNLSLNSRGRRSNVVFMDRGFDDDSTVAMTSFYRSPLQGVRPTESNWDYCTVQLSKAHSISSATIAHEFGHVMGLSHHITNPNSIMTQLYFGRNATAPTAQDIAIINNIY